MSVQSPAVHRATKTMPSTTSCTAPDKVARSLPAMAKPCNCGSSQQLRPNCCGSRAAVFSQCQFKKWQWRC